MSKERKERFEEIHRQIDALTKEQDERVGTSAVQLKAQQYYFDASVLAEFDVTFMRFMCAHNLAMNFIRQDPNNLPEFRIIGKYGDVAAWVDEIYDCGIQEENDEMKKYIKPYDE